MEYLKVICFGGIYIINKLITEADERKKNNGLTDTEVIQEEIKRKRD